MPALPTGPKVIQVRIKGKFGTADWLNGFYLEYGGGPPTAADLLTLGTAIGGQWQGNIGSRLAVTTVANEVELVDLNSYDGATNTAGGSWNGSVALPAAPANVAACVSFKQSRRFRGGHPRNYLCGIPDAYRFNEILLMESAATEYAERYRLLNVAIKALSIASIGAMKMVAVSRYQGHTFDADHNRIPTPLPVPIVREVTSFICNRRLDSQRRRLGS